MTIFWFINCITEKEGAKEEPVFKFIYFTLLQKGVKKKQSFKHKIEI